jgi:hypothetical protein
MAAIDLTGNVFGFLTVVERAGSNKLGTAMWRCLCDCGEYRTLEGTGLRAGRNKSCGCKSPKFTTARMKKHGLSRSREYRIWLGMRRRCSSNGSSKERRNYSERGINVCADWAASFDAFYRDMGPAPSGASLDRKENSKGYSPENCRWATYQEQANNTRANRILTFNGDSMTVAEWSRKLGIKQNTITCRLLRGWSIERALST